MTKKLQKHSRSGSSHFLNRILEESTLVTTVQSLPSQTFCKLIDHIGLEDSGELLALATAEQLTQLLDTDLWKSKQPGLDETFDVERLPLWFEVLLDAGEKYAAQKLTELPDELVMLAFHKSILVINNDELAIEMANRHEEVDLVEKALDSCLYHEFDEYQVISKQHEGWDAVLSILVRLCEDHYDFFQQILSRCCHASTDYIEDNGGLYNVLTSQQMLESDAAADREDRRAFQGFIAPSTAASFLRLAQQTPLSEIIHSCEPDPVTKAYFREFEPLPQNGRSSDADHKSPVKKLIAAMKDAGVLDERTHLLLLPSKSTDDDSDKIDLFQQALSELSKKHPTIYAQRLEELVYLANVLIAGCSYEGRNFSREKAMETTFFICNSGLERLLKTKTPHSTSTQSKKGAVNLLVIEPSHKFFRVGWHIMYKKVSPPGSLHWPPD